MPIVKGPHTIDFGAEEVLKVEEIDVAIEQDTNDYDTVQGVKYTVDTTMSSIVTLTLLNTDVTSLKVVLPQYFVASSGTLSTGETVSDAQGAIDVVPAGCYAVGNLKHLKITSCDETGAEHVLRIPDVSTRIDTVEIDGPGARKVLVQFRAEGTTMAQFFDSGAVISVS